MDKDNALKKLIEWQIISPGDSQKLTVPDFVLKKLPKLIREKEKAKRRLSKIQAMPDIGMISAKIKAQETKKSLSELAIMQTIIRQIFEKDFKTDPKECIHPTILQEKANYASNYCLMCCLEYD